jgi:hypothetical protein
VARGDHDNDRGVPGDDRRQHAAQLKRGQVHGEEHRIQLGEPLQPAEIGAGSQQGGERADQGRLPQQTSRHR